MISFWERVGLKFRPALSLTSYVAIVERGASRCAACERSSLPSRRRLCRSSSPIRSPISSPARQAAHRRAIVLVLFTIPFLINYIVRNVAWTGLLGRTGDDQQRTDGSGLIDAPIDWLLYSDFRGLRRADLVLYAVHDFSAGPVDRRDRPAISRGKRAARARSPFTTFRAITLPLSLPGMFAADYVRFGRLFRRKRGADHHGRRRL